MHAQDVVSVLTLGFWFCPSEGLSSKREKDSSKVLYTSESKVIVFSSGSKFLGIKSWGSVGLFFYCVHQEKNKIEVHQSMAILSQVTTTT